VHTIFYFSLWKNAYAVKVQKNSYAGQKDINVKTVTVREEKRQWDGRCDIRSICELQVFVKKNLKEMLFT
jgi:hypothetical protein